MLAEEDPENVFINVGGETQVMYFQEPNSFHRWTHGSTSVSRLWKNYTSHLIGVCELRIRKIKGSILVRIGHATGQLIFKYTIKPGGQVSILPVTISDITATEIS